MAVRTERLPILGVVVGAPTHAEQAFFDKCLAVAKEHHPNIDPQVACTCVSEQTDQKLQDDMIAARGEHDLSAASKEVILACGFHDG